jgi:hypothetical protein
MDATDASPGTAADRLRALIRFSGLEVETLAEARALGPALAGEVVAGLIEAELSHPTRERTALRAAHLARELGLTRAVPSLVRCIESRGEGQALWLAAIGVLHRLGTPALDALLSAFDASGDLGVRGRLEDVLARFPAEDDRIRVALVRLLGDAPSSAAWCLAERGEWRAIPDLIRTFDRLAERPIADCDICALEHLSEIACAVRMLGGTVSHHRQARIDALADRAQASWIPFADPPAPHAPTVRGPRPGRNDPCPCGSGRKFKRCCAGPDPRSERH